MKRITISGLTIFTCLMFVGCDNITGEYEFDMDKTLKGINLPPQFDNKPVSPAEFKELLEQEYSGKRMIIAKHNPDSGIVPDGYDGIVSGMFYGAWKFVKSDSTILIFRWVSRSLPYEPWGLAEYNKGELSIRLIGPFALEQPLNTDRLLSDVARLPEKDIHVLYLKKKVIDGCSNPELPPANGKLLDPKGGFTLYVSNQSYTIDVVDIRVEIDGQLVVSDYFHVGTQHVYIPFTLSLSEGKHRIRVWSVKGDARFERDFELQDQNAAVLLYCYYPMSGYQPTPRQFVFTILKGPVMFM